MEAIWQKGYEQVTFFHDEQTGTRSIISVHNTNLGPALGGTRMYPYERVEDALNDVLRLSRGMTYKAAMANLPLGGGKSIIWGDPKAKTIESIEAHGRFVDSLNGMYITAEDSGTTREDMDTMRKHTKYVVGTSEEKGGSGDPSPYTARGVLFGMEACAEKILKKPLGDCTIGIQGVGAVGKHLARMLREKGAKLYLNDVDESRVKELCDQIDATPIGAQEIIDLDCDIFSPNAMGATVSEENLKRFKCKVIAGAANNQLATDTCGDIACDSGIFYAPDYVVNAGGLISVCCEWFGYQEEKRDLLIAKIADTMSEIIDFSHRHQSSTHEIADRIAESRFKKKN